MKRKPLFFYSIIPVLLLTSALQLASLRINLLATDNEKIRLLLASEERVINTCLSSGLELQFKYEVRACKRRYTWFDKCGSSSVINKVLLFNPINETYRLVSDSDGVVSTQTFSNRKEALSDALQVEDLALLQIAGGRKDLINSRRSYLSARVECTCKGRYSKTLSELSYYLTLGLVSLGGFETGWINFALTRSD